MLSNYDKMNFGSNLVPTLRKSDHINRTRIGRHVRSTSMKNAVIKLYIYIFFIKQTHTQQQQHAQLMDE